MSCKGEGEHERLILLVLGFAAALVLVSSAAIASFSTFRCRPTSAAAR
jgi:hypothetical protein